MAISKLPRYNPAAYVPGSAPPAVAGATQARGTFAPRVPPRPLVQRPPVKPPLGHPSAPPAAALSPASALAASLSQPIIDQINAAAAARSQQGTNAITGYTTAQQKLLSQYSPLEAAAYGGAIQGQNAIDQALTQRLQGTGDQLSQELGGKLAAISADPATAARLNSALASDVAGAANTAYAKGSASLSALNAQGAAAGAYNASLPGIASLGGLQALKGLQGTINNDTAARVGDVTSKEPTLAYQIQQDLQQRADAKAAAAAKATQDARDYRFKVQQQADTNSYRNASLGLQATKAGQQNTLSYTKLKQQWSQHLDDLGIKEQNANTAAFRAETAYQKYLAGPTKGAKGGLTAAAVQHLEGQAGKIADTAFNGAPATQTAYEDKTTGDQYSSRKAAIAHGVDPTNVAKVAITGSTHLSYQQAIKKMLAQRIPLTIAQKALNTYWSKPGETQPWETPGEGRPKQSFQERNPGKAGAAAETAAYVTVAPNADRPGVGLNPAVVSFVGQVGQLAGRKLTIGTGTNHNEYVIGTHRVSDHWDGNAADIPASGPALTRLGQDALIAAGMPAAQARRQTGGLFNINGYQIIFNSMEGGNHFTHLHVGVRSGV